MIASASATLMFVAFVCTAFTLSGLLSSTPLGVLLSIALICLVGVDRSYFMAGVFGALSIVSVIYTLRKLRISRNEIAPCMISVAAVSAYSLGVNQYTSFDMMALAHSGAIHNDTIFHASISAMIKNYGSVSTGLHGLVETPYHILSHTIVAGFSRISGESILEVYGFIHQVYLLPLFIFSIAFASSRIKEAKNYDALFLVIISILLLLGADYFLFRWAFWDSYLLSESYTVSLIIILMSVPSLFQRDISAKSVLISVLVAYGAAQAKGSVGLVYLAAWSARLVFTGGWKRKPDLVVYSLVVLAFLLAAWRAAQANSSADMVAFDFIRSYSLYGSSISELINLWVEGGEAELRLLLLGACAMGSFIIFHFFFVWVAILHKFWELGTAGALRSPLVACCMGAMAFGMLIASVYSLPGGAVYYFSSVASFISLPAVVGIVYDWFRWGNRRFFGLGTGAGILIAVLCVAFITMNGTKGYDKLINRASSAGMLENEFVSSLRDLRTDAPINRVFRANSTALPMNPQKLCWTRPFSYPAISERAWTGVIEQDPDCVYQYYGYAYYGVAPGKHRVTVPLDPGEGLVIEDWQGPDRPE